MALIGQIRKKGSWILIILIGLGLGGFIVQDMLVSGPTGGASSQTELGKVNGEEINIQEFNRVESIVYSGGGNVYQQRESLWNFFVEDALLKQYGNKMGLNVSLDELKSLEFGPDYSPVIVQNFPNPQIPGLANAEQLNQIRGLLEGGGIDNAIQTGQLNSNFRSIWRHQENLVIKDRVQNKLSALIEKGMYTPSWMVEAKSNMETQTINFKFVKVPFDEIENSAVKVEDKDFAAYIQDNKTQFESDQELRKLSYIEFNVETTPEDSANIRDNIAGLIDGFSAAENDTVFIESNQGIFPGTYLKKTQLSASIADEVAALEVGSVYGPYLEAGTYRAVKLINKITLPDSVRSRHILIPINTADPANFGVVSNRMDSIKNAIEAGTTTFRAMNDRYNQDNVAQTDGGDLGYAGINGMVKPFNDLIFYEAEQGKLYTVITQFGMHLVEVTGKKFINNEEGYLIGYLTEDIIPSEATQKELYNEAFAFMTENRTIAAMTEASANNPNIAVKSSNAFDANAYQVDISLQANQSSREMVKWAFSRDAKLDKVASNVYEFSNLVKYYDDKYVVIALEEIIKPGLPDIASIRQDIEPAVMNLKKGEMLKQAMNAKSLDELASTYEVSIDTLENLSFSSTFLQEVGSEPKLVGEGFKLKQGDRSQPIIGETGVFVIELTEKTIPSVVTNIPQLRTQYNNTERARVNSMIMAALREGAKIKDNRSTYY